MTKVKTLKVGDRAEMTVAVTDDLVRRFAEYSGDYNPLHIDTEYAGATRFHRRVAHGMSYGSLFSRLIGMDLPGPGALWAAQSFRFAKPAFIGDELTLSVEVQDISSSTGLVTLFCRAMNQLEEEIMTGEGEVLFAMPVAVKPSEQVESGAKARNPGTDSRPNTCGDPSKPRNNQEGPCAIITGASRGIGAAIARKLDASGYSLAVVYRNSRSEAEAIAADCRSAIALMADLSDPGAARELPELVGDKLGPPRIVVLNASDRDLYGEAAGGSFKTFQRHWTMQLEASHALVSAALPTMLEAGWGRIVAVGSTYALGAPPAQMAPYVVAKAALGAWIKCLASEYGPKGIRANLVAAGMTETALLSAVPERHKKVAAAKNPMRRLGKPDDVADAVAFLIGDESRYVNGHSLVVSGGDVML